MKLLSSIKKWLVTTFVCTFKGHIAVKEVREDELRITQFKCKRCNNTLGFGYWKSLKKIYPPNSTSWQKLKYDRYCEEKENKLRQGITDY